MAFGTNISRRRFVVGLSAAALPIGLSAGRAGEQGSIPDGEPRRGGTMTFLLPYEPPFLLSLFNPASLVLSAKMTEGLLEFDRSMTPRGQLATDWTVSPDGLTYRFALRRGVRWHDGRDFTSADVAFSLRTLKKVHPRGRLTFANLAEIATPNDHSVVLRLTRPTPFLLPALSAEESPIVPYHVYRDGDPLANPNALSPIGTGPFKFGEWSRGNYVILERNPDYWDPPRPYLDRIVARVISDPQQRSVAFETGTADVGYRTPVPLRDVERLRQLPTLEFETAGYTYSPPNITCIEFNLDNPHLGRIEIRQAIAHMIDRDKIAEVVYFGQAVACPSPIVPELAAFHDSSPSPYPFDPDAAAKLLDDAGYPRNRDGMRFSLTLDYPADETFHHLAAFLRVMLGRAGIWVKTRGQDIGSQARRVYTDRAFDMQLASLSNLFDPAIGVQRLFWSKNYVKGVPFSNATHYGNPLVDKLLEDQAVETDPARRVAQWREIQRIILHEVPDLNLVMPRWYTIANRRLKGHSDTADGLEGNLAHAYLVEK